MKHLQLAIALSFLVTGCMPQGNLKEKAYNHSPAPTSVSTKALASGYSRRNFEQIIQTFSKVTGVHAGRRAIRIEVEAIKAQLPLNYDSASHNAFNQIAVTTLALRYCRELVSDNMNSNATVIFGVPNTDPAMKEKIATELINRFAYTTESDDLFLGFVREELVSALTPTNTILVNNNFYDNNVVVACSIFLSSSYFTLD